MQTLGDNIMLLRKQRRISQEALGKLIGSSGDVIGRYERSVITPSIEVVAKLADVFEVSIDYLAGKTSLKIDTPLLRKLEDIDRLKPADRDFVMRVLDMAIRDVRAAV